MQAAPRCTEGGLCVDAYTLILPGERYTFVLSRYLLSPANPSATGKRLY